jgi:hypothetical protein
MAPRSREQVQPVRQSGGVLTHSKFGVTVENALPPTPPLN